MSRASRGTSGNIKGNLAEAAAVSHYRALGAELLAQRYRAPSGEIDLILRKDAVIIFVEVKSRKTLNAALSSVTSAQWARIIDAAQVYLGETGQTQLEQRFDLFASDDQGQFEVIENATQDFL